MSRNVIVGLAVLVVAALGWIVIARLLPASTVPETAAPEAAVPDVAAPEPVVPSAPADQTAPVASAAPAVTPESPGEGTPAIEEESASADLSTLLTPEGFDADALDAYVDSADLTDLSRTALKADIQRARDTPDAIPEVVAQLRSRLGIE